jgi:hypothetical protein
MLRLSVASSSIIFHCQVKQFLFNFQLRAADWDLPNPMWIGRLKVVAVGENCKILLEENTGRTSFHFIFKGELFATCPVGPGAIEQVNDSSRYYVVRIVNEQGE